MAARRDLTGILPSTSRMDFPASSGNLRPAKKFRDPTADENPHTQIQIDQSDTCSRQDTEADEDIIHFESMEPETIPIYDIRLLNHRRHNRYDASRSLPISLAVTPMSEIDASSVLSSQWVIITDPVRPASTSLSYLSSRRSSNTLNSAAHFEDAFSKAGGFHNYQLRVLLVLCLTSLYCGPPLFIWNFLKRIPRHRCRVPPDDVPFNSSQPRGFLYPELHKYIPINYLSSKLEFNSCIKYDLTASNSVIPCDEFVYDTADPIYMKTPATDYNLVCDKEWIWKTAPVIFIVGTLVGAFIMGVVADRFGRRCALLTSMLLMIVGELLELIIPNPRAYMIIVGFTGMGVMGTLQTAFILAMELVGSSQRRPVGFTFYIFFFTGYFIATFYAYYISDWKIQKAALLLPGVAFITYWWILPESAQWLLTKGRTKEAEDMLSKAAQVNKGIEAGSIVFENKNNSEVLLKREPEGGCADIFSSSQPRNAFIVIFVIMLLVGIGPAATRMYFIMYDNIYAEFLLNGGLEIAGCIVGILFSPFFGRRQLFLVCSLLVSGAFLLMVILNVYDEWELFWIRIIAWKIFISTAVCNLKVLAAELFPTRARGTCVSICTVLIGVGEFINVGVRIIIEKERGRYGVVDKDPYLFYGFVAAAAGLLILLLPEMYNKPMPHTFSDCKDFNSYDTDFGGLIKIMQKIQGAKQNQRVQEILEQKRRQSQAASRPRKRARRTRGDGSSKSGSQGGSRDGPSSQPGSDILKPKKEEAYQRVETREEDVTTDAGTLDALSDDLLSRDNEPFEYTDTYPVSDRIGDTPYPFPEMKPRRQSSSLSEETLEGFRALGAKRRQKDLAARLAESKLEAKRKRRDSCSIDDSVSVTEMRDQQTQAAVETISLASLNENDL